MEEKLLELDEVHENFENVGRKLVESCDGEIFPADALFLSSCNRALQVLNGFTLLMKSGAYSCGMAMLRLQLDTVLRLNGITKTKDIHASANLVIQGTKLSKLKDKSGQPLKDFHLVNLLSENNGWVKHVYSLCSGYIHLSDMSFLHFMQNAEALPGSTEKLLYIGSDESYIEEKHKLELIQAFKVSTVAIQELTTRWTSIRHTFGAVEDLRKQYQSLA